MEQVQIQLTNLLGERGEGQGRRRRGGGNIYGKGEQGRKMPNGKANKSKQSRLVSK